MRKMWIVFAAVAALALCAWPAAMALAVDVPGVTAADFGNTAATTISAMNAEAHWIWTLLASEVVALIAGWAYLQITERIKENRYFQAVTAVGDAVVDIYHAYTRPAKANSKNGKLTIEQKNAALQAAYDKAIEIGRTRGFDLLKILGKETIYRLIEKFVSESKVPSVAAPLSVSASPPIPELEPVTQAGTAAASG